jgi:uncharacterized protein YfbU (UPF0304 family)
MDLTITERIIIANQFKILAKLYPEDAVRYIHFREALENGYKLHYAEIVKPYKNEMPEEECMEVINILDMYSALTHSYNRLQETTGVNGDEILFDGFDSNDETHQYLYANYVIKDLERFSILISGQSSPDLNSHSKRLGKYRKMLSVWKSYNKEYNLNLKQIRDILDAA